MVVVRVLNTLFPVIIGEDEIKRCKLLKEHPLNPVILIEKEICKDQNIRMKRDAPFYFNGVKYFSDNHNLLPWDHFDHVQIFIDYEVVDNPRPSVCLETFLQNFEPMTLILLQRWQLFCDIFFQFDEKTKNYTVDFALGKTRFRSEGCYSGFVDEAFDRMVTVFGLDMRNVVNFTPSQSKFMRIGRNQLVRLNTVPDEVCLLQKKKKRKKL